jgi:hypothetical protein
MVLMKIIRDSLGIKLNAIGKKLKVPVAFENVEFDPKGKEYLSETFILSSRMMKGIGNKKTMASGTYTINVMFPAGTNPAQASGTADQVASAYNADPIARFNGGYVRTTNARPLQGVVTTDGTYYMLPVQMEWTGYAKE